MKENIQNKEYTELQGFVSNFQTELSKENIDLTKINEMYSILKNKIKEYYSSRKNDLNFEDKELLEKIMLEVILKLPGNLEQDNYEELIDLIMEPYAQNIHIAIRLQILVQRLSMNGVSSDNCRRILDKISSMQYQKNDNFSRENFDWCIFMLKSNFVMELPIEILEENIEWLADIYVGNSYSDFSIRVFKELSVEKIDKIIDKISIPISIDNIQIFKRYFEYLLSKDDNAIINNNFAAQIFSFLSPLIEDKRVVEFKIIIEEKRKKYQYPDMTKYSKFILQSYSQELEKMDQATFDEFCKDLEKIKVLDGIIPEQYCDFLISQKIDSTSILNADSAKYFSILKRAFEDKARYVLKRDGITDYLIFFSNNENNDSIDRNEAYVEYGIKRVVFEESNLQKLSEDNSYIINNIFHECRHAWQLELFEEEDLTKIDGNIYNMIKEFVIRLANLAFYKMNYYRMYCEIDARCAGAVGQAKYLLYLGIDPNKTIENVGYRSLPLVFCDEAIKVLTKKELKWASDKVDFDGNIVSINDILKKIIKEKPEFLERFPALQIEFDRDGERKSTIDILNGALANQENLNIQDIYTKIFECRNTVELSSAIQTLDAISDLLQRGDTISDTTINYIKLIVENEILNSLVQSDREDINFDILVLKLKEFIGNNNNFEIMKSIAEKFQEFLKNGFVKLDSMEDDVLKGSVASNILKRNILSIQDFIMAIEDLKRVTDFDYYEAKELLKKMPIKLRKDAFEELKKYLPTDTIEVLFRSGVIEGKSLEEQISAFEDISGEITKKEKMQGKKILLWFANKLKFVKSRIKNIFKPEDR